MRRFASLIVLLLPLILPAETVATASLSTGAQPPQRIIIIQADDLGYGDLGSSGNPYARTPNLDRLAAESARVADFTVNPVCAASRASLLTGRHFLRTGVSHVHGGKDFLHPDERTIADAFRAAGWATAMWGKWHLGTGPGFEPWERGFATAARFDLYRHRDARENLPEGNHDLNDWADHALIDHAIQYLDTHPQERALLYLASMSPHTPLAAPEEYRAPFLAQGLSPALADLHGMVSFFDAQVGRLLDYLEKNGLADSTLLLVTSDNGPAINRGILDDRDRRLRRADALRGWKGDLWQGGVQVPLFVRWPAHLRPGVVAQPIDQIDLLPTLARWCGVDLSVLPYPLDGVAQNEALETLSSDPAVDHDIFNHAHVGWLTSARAYDPRGLPGEYDPISADAHAPERDGTAQPISVRRGRFKLLRNPFPPTAAGLLPHASMLIDLYEDPGETTDTSELHPGIRRELDAALDTWFGTIVHAPHAFAPPVLNVRATETQILARTPAKLQGNLQNTVKELIGWHTVGDTAIYALNIQTPRVRRVTLQWNKAPESGTLIHLRLLGQTDVLVLSAPDWSTTFPTAWPLGRVDLELRLAAPANLTTEARLMALQLGDSPTR